MIAKMFAQGKSARAVACMLTEKKIPTARGGTWTAVQVNAIARRRTLRQRHVGRHGIFEALQSRQCNGRFLAPLPALWFVVTEHGLVAVSQFNLRPMA